MQVYALIEDLYRVDEQVYTFTIVFGMLLQYNDSATAEYVMNDDASNCSFYCSSDPTVTLNNDGVPACCDRAFIPAVQAVNLISYEGDHIAIRCGHISVGDPSKFLYNWKTKVLKIS